MSLAVERAEAADVAALDEIAEAAYAPYVERMGREPAPMRADHAAAVAEGCVLVARESVTSRDGDADGSAGSGSGGTGGTSRVVGYATIRTRPDSLHLESVAVHPACAGRGIGRVLIAHVERLALAEGHGVVDLYTNAAMHENLVLYPALGYVEIGRRTEGGFERVFFEKRLHIA